MKCLLLVFPLVLFSSGVVSGPLVDSMNGVAVTPDVYKVTLEKIEFKQTSGSYTTFWSGSEAMDIASVDAGSSVASVATGLTIPDGSYTHLRIQVGNTFTIKGSTTDATTGGGTDPCRTATGYTTNAIDTGTVYMTQSSGDGGTAVNQSVDVPVDDAGAGTTVYDAMVAASMGMLSSNGSTATSWDSNDSLGSLTMEVALASTLTIDSISGTYPTMSIDFKTTDGIEFADSNGNAGGGNCIVLMMPPVMTVTVNGTATAFEPSL